MKFVSIGYGNTIAADRIVLITGPEAAPVKRMVADAKEQGRVIDASSGRKTRSVIVTDSEHIILSALTPDTLTQRLGGTVIPDAD